MMTSRKIVYVTVAATLLASLTACSSAEKPKDTTMQTGSLTSTYNMVGQDNRLYGKVEMNPVTGGTVYDAQGQVIGKIVPNTVSSHSKHRDDD